MYLALTTYNRFDILQRSIKSLFMSLFLPDTKLVIADDCSSDVRVKTFLSDIVKSTISNLSIELILREKRLGCNQNMISTIKYCFEKSKEQFVISIDSDTVYNSQWMIKMIEAKDSVKNDKIGMLTIYDSTWHGTEKQYNNFLKTKHDLGGFSCLLNKDLFMLPQLKIEAWDWSYVNLCKSNNYLMLCTLNSYVQHIGKSGEHSDGSDGWDHAANFIGE